MSHGLQFLHHISQAPISEKVGILQASLLEVDFFLTRALEKDPYDYCFQTGNYQSWRRQCEERFQSDQYGPNAAWTWSTGKKVEILYFQREKEDLRRWGYVMWDKERLDRWGVLDQDNQPYICKNYE